MLLATYAFNATEILKSTEGIREIFLKGLETDDFVFPFRRSCSVKPTQSRELNTSPRQLMIFQGLSPSPDVLLDPDLHFQLLAGHFHVHVPKRHHTQYTQNLPVFPAPNHSPLFLVQ